jgi:hypothetical protein
MAIDPELEARLRELAEKRFQDLSAQGDALMRSGGNKGTANGYYAAANSVRGARLDEALDYANRGLGMDSLSALRGVLTGENETTSRQALEEMLPPTIQRDRQNTQLQDFRNRAETQIFGAPGASIQDALGNQSSELGGLGEFLKTQQSQVFQENLRPLINMKLNAQGLGNSGANVELQSKALGDLERSRQSQLMTAGLGYKDNIRGLERSDILGNIGSQQAALNNMSGLQRMGITMQFENDMMNRREALARELASVSNTGPSTLQQVLGYGMAAGGVIGAPFTGGASLAMVPGGLSMATMGGGQGTAAAGAGMASAGQSFYAGQNNSSYGINNTSGYGYKGYAPGYPTYSSMGPSWNG